MILCGCRTTSMDSGSVSNSQQASISSSPLFIMVAESTDIFRPIFQLGCAQACSGVTESNDSKGAVLKGPPEAVSHILLMAFFCAPAPLSLKQGAHCQIALCSLSIGNRVALFLRTVSINNCPDITSDSLFASRTRLPARAAARVGSKPAAPTIAAIT